MAHDVFISHSAKDKPIADAVCATLEKDGIRCWIAPRDIVPGTQWGEAIIDAISECRVMVLVFSSNANESQQIIREVERAVSKGIPVIPFRVEDVDPNKSLEYFISAPHWLDALSPPLEKHLEQLSSTITLLLAKKGAAPPKSEVSSEAAAAGPALDSEPHIETVTASSAGSGGKKALPGGMDTKKIAGGIAAVVVLVLIVIFLLPGDDDDDIKISQDNTNKVVPSAPVNEIEPTAPPPLGGVVWGAIAASPNRGWGLAKQLPTKEAAEKDAIERCSKSNSGCELRTAFSNCAVYATSSDGTWAWATDSTVDLARPAAIAECHKYTSQLCDSYIEMCADGSVMRVNIWAAIAVGDKGKSGMSWNYPTRQEAINGAVAECGKSDTNCKVKLSYIDCGALARSEDGALGWAHYSEMNKAVEAAMRQCESVTDTKCGILAQVCANGRDMN